MSGNVSGRKSNLKSQSEGKGEEDVKNGEDVNVRKVSCELCNAGDDVRIVLRQCGHVVCLPCILEYIKNRIRIDGRPRFKCPLQSCHEIVHENDINAVLDEKEPALEVYMPIGHRRYLQYKQNKHSITAALPSGDIKRCPLCRAIYSHEQGCNYVICANSACNTSFCWQCEKPIGRPSTHFTSASKCRLGYTDYERLLHSVQLVLDVNVVVLLVFFPLIYLVAFIYIPVVIFFAVPICLVYDVYRKEREAKEFFVPLDVVMIVFRSIILAVLGLLASIPITLGSIVSGFGIVLLYILFVVIRTLPCGLSGDRVGKVLCLMRWAGRLFKIGPYGTLLDEARRERHDAMSKLEENQDDFENAISESAVLVDHPKTSQPSNSESVVTGTRTGTTATTTEKETVSSTSKA